jgi:hypothetical protein
MWLPRSYRDCLRRRFLAPLWRHTPHDLRCTRVPTISLILRLRLLKLLGISAGRERGLVPTSELGHIGCDEAFQLAQKPDSWHRSEVRTGGFHTWLADSLWRLTCCFPRAGEVRACCAFVSLTRWVRTETRRRGFWSQEVPPLGPRGQREAPAHRRLHPGAGSAPLHRTGEAGGRGRPAERGGMTAPRTPWPPPVRSGAGRGGDRLHGVARRRRGGRRTGAWR